MADRPNGPIVIRLPRRPRGHGVSPRRIWKERAFDRTIGFAIATAVAAWSLLPLTWSLAEADSAHREWAMFVAISLCYAASFRPNLFSPLTMGSEAIGRFLFRTGVDLARGGPLRRRRRSLISGRPRKRRPAPQAPGDQKGR